MKRVTRLMVIKVAMVLFATSGCARWTLWPGSSTPAPEQQPTAPQQQASAGREQAGRSQERPSLLKAVGLSRSQEAPGAPQQQMKQMLNEDLARLDPALAIARLTERQGDPNEARRQYLRYLEKHPEHPLPHHRLGVMAARQAKYKEAEVHFQKAAQLGPPNAELLSDMGYLYYLQNRLQEAEAVLRQASKMEPANQTATNNLALVLGAKGNFDNSLRHFRKVNEEGEARANLAFVFSQHGNLEKARGEYLQALTVDNSLKNAAKALLQVEKARKRRNNAIGRQPETTGEELIEGQASATGPHPAVSQQRRTPAISQRPQGAASQAPADYAASERTYNSSPPREIAARPQQVARAEQDARAQMLMAVPPADDASRAAAARRPAQAQFAAPALPEKSPVERDSAKRFDANHFNADRFNADRFNADRFNADRFNAGHVNAGHVNAGHVNAGHVNAGHVNAGHVNAGHVNAGHEEAAHLGGVSRASFEDRPAGHNGSDWLKQETAEPLQPASHEEPVSAAALSAPAFAEPNQEEAAQQAPAQETPVRQDWQSAWQQLSERSHPLKPQRNEPEGQVDAFESLSGGGEQGETFSGEQTHARLTDSSPADGAEKSTSKSGSGGYSISIGDE